VFSELFWCSRLLFPCYESPLLANNCKSVSQCHQLWDQPLSFFLISVLPLPQELPPCNLYSHTSSETSSFPVHSMHMIHAWPLFHPPRVHRRPRQVHLGYGMGLDVAHHHTSCCCLVTSLPFFESSSNFPPSLTRGYRRKLFEWHWPLTYFRICLGCAHSHLWWLKYIFHTQL
jgi:hypothetical protein